MTSLTQDGTTASFLFNNMSVTIIIDTSEGKNVITNVEIINDDDLYIQENIDLIARVNSDINKNFSIMTKFYNIINQHKLASMNKNFEEELKKINGDHKSSIDQLAKSYEQQIIDLKQELDRVHTNIQYLVDSKCKDKLDYIDDKYKELLKRDKEYYDKEITSQQMIISKMANQYDTIVQLLSKTKNLSAKGQEGEATIHTHLQEFVKYNNEAKVTDVSGETGDGDLQFEHRNLNCCIEVKNVQSAISSRDMDKFHNRSIMKTKYNCAIIVSIKSGYQINSGIKDMSIAIINTKPVVYIAKYEEYPEKLYMAINILCNMISFIKQNDDVNMTIFIEEFRQQYEYLNNIVRELTNITKSVGTIKNIIETSKKRINDLINIEEPLQMYATVCGKKYKTVNAHIKHMQSCTECSHTSM